MKKPIFLTFNDGYKNNWKVVEVFQKLKNERFQPQGTFFVISDFIGRPNRLSRADLKEMVRSGLIPLLTDSKTPTSRFREYEEDKWESGCP